MWIGTLAVVVAIYSTLGLAGTLVEKLGDGGLLDAALFLLGMLLVGVTILTYGLRIRPGGPEIGMALGVAAVYFMMLLRMTLSERSHLIEYSVVAVFIHEALRERVDQGRRVPAPALLALLVTSAVGTLDEGIQGFVPSRVFDPVDIMFNVLAALMAIAAHLTLGWVRRRRSLFRTRSEEET